MSRNRPTVFTAAEDAIIRSLYSVSGSAAVGRQIGKTAKQVRNRASYLGAGRKLVDKQGQRWAPRERYNHRALAAALGFPDHPPGNPCPSGVTVHLCMGGR